MRIDARDRIIGAFLGLAIGDALGVPVEFAPRGDRDKDPVTGMRSFGTWGQRPGTWSDDTSLALCLAESIVERGFDPEDFARRALSWLDEARWTARGAVFDVGGSTRRSLARIRSGMPAILAGGRGENDNGNGSLVRSLAASIWAASMPEPARFQATASWSAATHGHSRCFLAVWLHALIAKELLSGSAPREAYMSMVRAAAEALPGLPLSVRAEAGSYSRLLDGSLADLPRDAVRGSGYVVHCLEASIWCLLNAKSFEDCVLKAVNLGEDSDTTAAAAGGLAGLAWGRAALPANWLEVLARVEDIEALAMRFAALCIVPRPFPSSYWLLPGKLLAGQHPRGLDESATRARLGALLSAGITGFVDLTEPGEEGTPGTPDSYGVLLTGEAEARAIAIDVRRVPVRDFGASVTATKDALGEIDDLLSSGRSVYVHCMGGIGRTGTVVGAWLVERGLAPGGTGLGLLQSFRSAAGEVLPSPETAEQKNIVSSWRPGPDALAI